jgi:hypothetical protein
VENHLAMKDVVVLELFLMVKEQWLISGAVGH